MGRLTQLGRQLHEWVRQSGKVQGFHETLCGSDFSCRSCPEESAQLVVHRCKAVLRHGLEASEGLELGLGLEHTLYGLGSQSPDQLVLEIGYAREEAEGFKGRMGGHRNDRVSQCAADVLLVRDVIHAAEVRGWVCPNEVRKHAGVIRHASSRADLDVIQAQVATDAVGKRTDCGCVAVALNEHEGTNRWRGCHKPVGTVMPNDCVERPATTGLPRRPAHQL